MKNLALAVLFALLIAAHWALPTNRQQRNFHYFPDMVDSLALEAQGGVELATAGPGVLLGTPEGSVARGHLPLELEATPEGAKRAGEELASPIAAGDGDAIARGAFVFATFCATCHGPGGLGDGPVTRRGVPPPPSLLAGHAVEMPDGQMFHVVTYGQGNMASYAAQVERQDRWKVIAYLRQLQGKAVSP